MSTQKEPEILARSLTKRAMVLRLRRLQALCTPFGSADETKPEAVLVINGVDGQYNHGSRILTNYLVRGLTGNELYLSSSSNNILDEVFLVITHSHVRLYCTPESWKYLAPRVSGYGSLHTYLLDKKGYEDLDAAEEHKIRSFIDATKSFKRIGIPLSLRSNGTILSLDSRTVLNIEQWPLIQSYALEGFGSGGFFSMKHKVEDISQHVLEIVTSADAISIRDVLANQIPRISLTWASFTANIDRMYANKTVDSIILEELAEPLLSYHAYGNMATLTSSPRPPVLYLGPEGSEPLYIVSELRQPHGPVRFIRTYFLTHGGKLDDFHLNEVWSNLVEDEPNPSAEQDLQISKTIAQIYSALVTSVQQGISSSSKKKSPADFFTDLFGTLLSPIVPGLDARKFTIVESDEVNLDGESGTSGKSGFKFFGVQVSKLPVSVFGKTVTISFAYGDTYVTSLDGDGHNIILSQLFESCLVWPDKYSKPKIELQRSKLERLNQKSTTTFGKFLTDLTSDVCVGFPESLLKYSSFRLFAFQRGFILWSPRLGPIATSFEADVSSIHLVYDCGATKDTLFVSFKFKEDSKHKVLSGVSFVNEAHGSSDTQFAVFVSGGTLARRTFRTQILPVWQDLWNVLGISITKSESIPFEYESVFQDMEIAINHQKKLDAVSPANEEFLLNWSIDEAVGLNHSIKTRYLQELQADVSEHIKVHIISEFPGSGGHVFSKSLLSAAERDQIQMHVVTPEEQKDLESYNCTYIIDSLKRFLGLHDFKSFEKTYAVIFIPGTLSLPEFVGDFLKQIDEESLPFVMSSVSFCLNPKILGVTQRHYYPEIMDLVRPGWIQQLILVEYYKLTAAESAHAQDFLKSLGVKIPIIRFGRDGIVDEQDLDSFLTCKTFLDADNIRDRVICTPHWATALVPPKKLFTTVSITLSNRLSKNTFLEALNKLLCRNASSSIVHVQGTIRFAEPDEVLRVNAWKLSAPDVSGKLNISTETSHMLFFGSKLDETEIRKMLRSCFAKPRARLALRTEASITAEESERFHRETRELPLPEGYFFDGQRFLHYELGASFHHPEYPRVVREFISQENARIQELNEQIDAENQKHQDSF